MQIEGFVNNYTNAHVRAHLGAHPNLTRSREEVEEKKRREILSLRKSVNIDR